MRGDLFAVIVERIKALTHCSGFASWSLPIDAFVARKSARGSRQP
ncbi:MAG: hypothetical protein ACI915_004751 [Gammaproteobacteria bacterium]|jgi:hypothetical protein